MEVLDFFSIILHNKSVRTSQETQDVSGIKINRLMLLTKKSLNAPNSLFYSRDFSRVKAFRMVILKQIQ